MVMGVGRDGPRGSGAGDNPFREAIEVINALAEEGDFEFEEDEDQLKLANNNGDGDDKLAKAEALHYGLNLRISTHVISFVHRHFLTHE